jgi:hypothetical protein
MDGGGESIEGLLQLALADRMSRRSSERTFALSPPNVFSKSS